MNQANWSALLTEIRALHEKNAAVQEFLPFPANVSPQAAAPHSVPAATLMQADPGLVSKTNERCVQAVVACAAHAAWLEPYKTANVNADFLRRFGCYGIIAPNAPFASAQMRAWIVYMPAGLWYPWHHHPAEELYLTLAGEARFLTHGAPDQIMTEGSISRHASNQPHATQTTDKPFLAYVVWRNGFDTAPSLTGHEQLLRKSECDV